MCLLGSADGMGSWRSCHSWPPLSIRRPIVSEMDVQVKVVLFINELPLGSLTILLLSCAIPAGWGTTLRVVVAAAAGWSVGRSVGDARLIRRKHWETKISATSAWCVSCIHWATKCKLRRVANHWLSRTDCSFAVLVPSCCGAIWHVQ